MNTKLKLALLGSIVTISAVGTATAFAATASSTTSSTPTKTSSATEWGKGEHGHGHRPGMVGINMDTLAKVLNIDSATLKSDLQSGQSLADIAKSQGVSEDTLITTLQNDLKTKLDAQVTSGKMTSAQEQQILSKFSSRATQMVEQKGGFKMGPGPGRHGHLGFTGMADVAKAIGISETTLKSGLQSGQSIVDIAASHNVSEQELVTKLQADLKSNLDTRVSSGKMTAVEEQQTLSQFSSRVTTFLEHKGGFSPQGKQGGPVGTVPNDQSGDSTSTAND